MDDKTLGLLGQTLGEIKLPVNAVISQRSMTPRTLLGLRVGDVIPGGKFVGEPMELHSQGRPVALGEVVFVNGRFGLRLVRALPPGGE